MERGRSEAAANSQHVLKRILSRFPEFPYTPTFTRRSSRHREQHHKQEAASVEPSNLDICEEDVLSATQVGAVETPTTLKEAEEESEEEQHKAELSDHPATLPQRQSRQRRFVWAHIKHGSRLLLTRCTIDPCLVRDAQSYSPRSSSPPLTSKSRCSSDEDSLDRVRSVIESNVLFGQTAID